MEYVMKLDIANCAYSHLNIEGKHSETMKISAATWGTSEFKYINFVHNLACRYVLEFLNKPLMLQ